MDEPTVIQSSTDTTAARRVPSWLVVTLLVAAGLGLRFWVIARTEVAARDSVGFIRYVLRLERDPTWTVLKEGEQPPGYPAIVMLVSWPVRAWHGATDSDAMVLSCQIASAIMAVLSIFPTVMLGRELGSRQIGWIAAGLVLCLPAWLRVTSDGLAEGAYLFWMATALWLGARGLRRPGFMSFAGCGLAAGAAYLTRPEGLEIVVAIGAVLAGRQIVKSFRQPWGRAVPQMLALACGLLVCVVPYVSATGRLSNKNTSKYMLGDPDINPDGVLPQYGKKKKLASVGPEKLKVPLSPAGGRTLLGAWFHESSGIDERWLWASKSLAFELVHAFQFVGLGLAVIGLAVFRPRSGTGAMRAALAIIVSLHALILCRMASLSGYLSERHMLLFVFAGSFPAAAALIWLGRFNRRIPAGILTCGLVIAGLLIAGPALTKPLHYNRAGHKEAGRWLAKNIGNNDAILDSFCWAEFYAGRLEPRVTTDRPDRLFVILEINENQHSRLPTIQAAKDLATLGEIVYRWPEKKPRDGAQVVVYAIAGEKLPLSPATGRKTEYRVGAKAANPIAEGPSTARGGSS